jgi:hypothetical protein
MIDRALPPPDLMAGRRIGIEVNLTGNVRTSTVAEDISFTSPGGSER